MLQAMVESGLEVKEDILLLEKTRVPLGRVMDKGSAWTSGRQSC